MRFHLESAILLLGLGAPLRAQEPDAPAPPSEPTLAAREKLASLDAEVTAFVKQWREEQTAQRAKDAEEARKATAEGRPAPKSVRAIAMAPNLEEFAVRALAWSGDALGEDRALFLAKAVQLGGLAKNSKALPALERLVDEHAASKQWESLGHLIPQLARAVGEERAGAMWRRLAENPSGDVRGWVALAQHGPVLKNADRDSAEYAAAKAAMLAAAEKVSDARLRSQLEGAIDLREKLADGAVAPDIEGVDLEGVAFKLSDYKGKVVFLDFWGDW